MVAIEVYIPSGFFKSWKSALENRLGSILTLLQAHLLGGVIALGIASGLSLKKIEKVFIDHGESIFPKPINVTGSWQTKPFRYVIHLFRTVRAIFRPIHDSAGLKSVLVGLFSEKTMKELDKAYVAVTAANLSTGGPKMFKTPHHEDIYLDADLKVYDVALATSAAPAYFPIHEVTDINTFFADGALMGNAPGLFGWLEAKTRLNVPEEEISVLSVGTLAGKPSISGSTKPKKGAWFWLSPGKLRLLTFLMSQQEQLTNHMLNLLLGRDRYHLIDGSISDEAVGDIDLDDASLTAQKTLISHAEKHFAEFTNTEFCKAHFPRKEAANA